MKPSIDDIVRQQKEEDLICPMCYHQMRVKVIRKASKWVRKVEKLICECGYHTIKRSTKEILRDVGEEDYFKNKTNGNNTRNSH